MTKGNKSFGVDIVDLKTVRLGNISQISTGLVLRRKQGSVHNIVKEYKLLTVKSFEEDGWINENELDIFPSMENLDSKYLTQEGDVIIRLSHPNTAVTISNLNQKFVISSLFASIRLDTNLILPGYLSIFINSHKSKGFFDSNTQGSGLKMVRTSDLNNMEILILPIKDQLKIVELNKKILEEKSLFMELIKKKDEYYKEFINKLLEGES